MKNNMTITFLGTGTSIGVPVIACECDVCLSKNPKDNRTRSSILIQIANKDIVIDCGPDFRLQMLRENIKNIDAIIFTHEHRDHIAGLDDVRAFNYILNKAIPIYANESVIDSLKTEFPYIFEPNHYFGAPQLEINIIDLNPFYIENIKVTPIFAQHNHCNVFGYRINDFTYITDAHSISDEELEKIKGSKVLVLNALRKSKHWSHFSLNEAVEIVNIIKPEKAYFIHMSHFIGLHDSVNKELPDNIQLAYDGLKINLI